MARLVDRSLPSSERSLRSRFYARLSGGERRNVGKVISVIDGLARNYFREYTADECRERGFRDDERGPVDLASYAFVRDSDIGCAFFSVYGIGGNITKKGKRPDIDLLFVSNAWGEGGFFSRENDGWFLPALEREFRSPWDVRVLEKLPDHYAEGANANKGLIRLTNPDATPLDVVYVRSFPIFTDERRIIRPEEFESLDISQSGEQLPRLLLYRAVTDDITPPEPPWQW